MIGCDFNLDKNIYIFDIDFGFDIIFKVQNV